MTYWYPSIPTLLSSSSPSPPSFKSFLLYRTHKDVPHNPLKSLPHLPKHSFSPLTLYSLSSSSPLTLKASSPSSPLPQASPSSLTSPVFLPLLRLNFICFLFSHVYKNNSCPCQYQSSSLLHPYSLSYLYPLSLSSPLIIPLSFVTYLLFSHLYKNYSY